ncbi:class II D-tagatose-bisphosphate aldolase, non-catalytic subunit [Gymnodinialimonas sp. 2305UL16-5]|uniref:class II D-tagatose-bisphosphate aldolase non-catalytic subunit n=1 Tax=Gymnodinialimonas mytili TaxID=3126503 RepID=UPI0030A6F361
MSELDRIITANRTAGGPPLPSICSAHGDVLTAALLLAAELDRTLLVEATSNQVNHQGGYTGQTPSDFLAAQRARAKALNVDADRMILGGDHLGPQAWKSAPPDEAMAEAEAMIAAYVQAGFTKIHLDCSEGCTGEPAQLSDGPAAARAAFLANVAETHAPDPGALRYIIGTEVPPPGGAREGHAGIDPTPPDRATATLTAHAEAFAAAGLDAAFDRVRALVVQPGVEFGPDHVDHFDPAAPDHLSSVLDPHPLLCFEAHSTDYQHPNVFAELARRRFAILKVGPALTFAWREAAYALSHLAGWLDRPVDLPRVMGALMEAHPDHWRGHYPVDQPLLRHFGLADRIRYYWATPEAQGAVAELHGALADAHLPRALVTQYVPEATLQRAEGLDLPWPQAILVAHVQRALLPYYEASPC